MSKSSKQAIIGLGLLAALLVTIAGLAMRGAGDRGLRADVLSTRRAEPGEQVEITVSVRDNLGAVKRVDLDFGDGNVAPPLEVDPACQSDFAHTETFDYTHTYERRGPFTVRATVVSGGCGAEDEEVDAIRTIDVKPLRRS